MVLMAVVVIAMRMMVDCDEDDGDCDEDDGDCDEDDGDCDEDDGLL